jgi:hypothetical protein
MRWKGNINSNVITMGNFRFQLSIIALLFSSLINAQIVEDYYTLENNTVLKKGFKDIDNTLDFVRDDLTNVNALSFGFMKLGANIIPLLVDAASKLFYNPDNFNKEYYANYSFFDPSGRFNRLDPNSTMIFEKTGISVTGDTEIINRFEFDLGAVENVDGYYYMGLKSYEVNYSWAKLSSPKNKINYVLEIGFFYFDSQDLPQVFYMNPIVLERRILPNTASINAINYQVIPKMKVLQSVRIHIREVNSKKDNWDNYLELYQNNQRNISNFLIKALPEYE